MKRIQAYVSNQQILAAEMNSLAAASGGDSNNTISAIGTGLDVFPWIYNAAELAAATPVKVDSAMDYRDRIITKNAITIPANTTRNQDFGVRRRVPNLACASTLRANTLRAIHGYNC